MVVVEYVVVAVVTGVVVSVLNPLTVVDAEIVTVVTEPSFTLHL